MSNIPPITVCPVDPALILAELEVTYNRRYRELAAPPTKPRYMGVTEKVKALEAGEFTIDWERLETTQDATWPAAVRFNGEVAGGPAPENRSQGDLTDEYRAARTALLFGDDAPAREFLRPKTVAVRGEIRVNVTSKAVIADPSAVIKTTYE